MSKNNQARAITGDEDTDSILAEMEAGGEQLPVFADAPSEDDETEEAGDEESTEETEDEDAEEEAEDPTPEPAPAPTAKKAPKKAPKKK